MAFISVNRPLPSREAIALEGKAFPFGQRAYHLSVEADIWDVKADRAFNPVEVIVESRIFVDKQGADTRRKFSALPKFT